MSSPKTPLRALVEVEPAPAVDSDALPFTFAEMDFLIEQARRVTMRHKLFTLLGFEWEVNPQLMALMIVVHGKVPDRDACSTYDAERYDIETGLVFDRQPMGSQRWREDYGTGLGSMIAVRVQPRHQPLVPIVSRIPVKVKRSQLADSRALTQHLAREARSAMIYTCTHEIEEMIRLDDERPFEPHQSFTIKVTI